MTATDELLAIRAAELYYQEHKAQGAVGVQGGGRASRGLGQQGGGAGFVEQVEAVVAGGAVGADGDVDPGLPQPFHRAEAAGQFQVGLRAVNHRAVAFYQQGQVVVADLGHVHGLEARAQQAQASEAGQRAFAPLGQALLHFEGGFMHVHMNAGVQLFGQHADVFQLVVADGVRRMGAEGDRQARVLTQVVEQVQALAQRLIGIAGAGNREVQHRHADLCADAAGVDHFAGHFREEVHVREAGDAPFKLLGDGQFSAVAHEGFIDPARFGGPDVLFQPGHQW